jgi:hypothetical protein
MLGQVGTRARYEEPELLAEASSEDHPGTVGEICCCEIATAAM